MSQRYSGGVISATSVEPAGNFGTSAASGVWSLQEALKYTQADNWPNPDNIQPRGLFAGGLSGSLVNIIEFVTIASTGNASDFGDLASTNFYHATAFAYATRGVVGGGNDN